MNQFMDVAISRKPPLSVHRRCALTTVALLCSALGSSQLHAAPEVTGTVISWPDNGWYQVQDANTLESFCQGGRSCDVSVGTYNVINLTTGERFESISVTGDSTTEPPVEPPVIPPAVPPVVPPVVPPAGSTSVTVEGLTISWPDDGWYQVQDATSFESLCEGGRSCVVSVGTYNVLNLTTGERFESISVTDGSTSEPPVEPPVGGPTAVTVTGSRISWPDDGYYQVQDAEFFREFCQGGSSCDVPDGVYNVINLTNGARVDGVVVGTIATPLEPIASPNPADPFGSLLEQDPESSVAGGPPTQPKNLRLDLVSNNWAEFSWAPANDDGDVVEYTIYRSDGVIYRVREDQTDPNAGAQDEIDKFWSTTSFIDCNFTRFDDRLHQCSVNAPVPGSTYSYEVTAVDDDGLESVASEPLTITYLEETGAPVPLYRDFYKGGDDTFANDANLSEVSNWKGEFDLVFSDEFNGSSIDPVKWQTGLTWGDSRIINGEQQYFVNTQLDPDFGFEPFTFTGESMIINAIPVPDDLRANLPPVCDEEDPFGLDRCEFLSGALSTHDRFQFIYGYTEGRFKVSGAPGALSSFYLYHRYAGEGVNFHAPEIDIVEFLGENPFGDEDAFQTYHYGDPNTRITRSAPTMNTANPDGGTFADNNEWHTFGVLWEPQLVIWYIDGVEVKRLFGPQVSRQPMTIINYLVAGSSWAPTPDVSNQDLFPLQFEADYIRVYQRDAFKGTATFGP